MSLNLLLGFTGQLSLGHVAFFGIGAYVSALTALGFDVSLPFGLRVTPRGRRAAPRLPARHPDHGACWLPHRPAVVPGCAGAYFVIVTISFAEVVRLVALNWVELTQGPLALTAIPNMVLPVPGPRRRGAALQDAELLSGAGGGGGELSPHRAPRRLALRPRHAGAEGERIPRFVPRHQRDAHAHRRGHHFRRHGGVRLAAFMPTTSASSIPTCSLFSYTVTMVIMVVSGGKGTLAGPLVGGIPVRYAAGGAAPGDGAGSPVDRLRRHPHRHPVPDAAWHRAGIGRASASASPPAAKPASRRT